MSDVRHIFHVSPKGTHDSVASQQTVKFVIWSAVPSHFFVGLVFVAFTHCGWKTHLEYHWLTASHVMVSGDAGWQQVLPPVQSWSLRTQSDGLVTAIGNVGSAGAA